MVGCRGFVVCPILHERRIIYREQDIILSTPLRSFAVSYVPQHQVSGMT